jgi:WD40 repeat protein
MFCVCLPFYHGSIINDNISVLIFTLITLFRMLFFFFSFLIMMARNCASCDVAATWHNKGSSEFYCDAHIPNHSEQQFQRINDESQDEWLKRTRAELRHRMSLISVCQKKLLRATEKLKNMIDEQHELALQSLKKLRKHYKTLSKCDEFTPAELEELQRIQKTVLSHKSFKFYGKDDIINYYAKDFVYEHEENALPKHANILTNMSYIQKSQKIFVEPYPAKVLSICLAPDFKHFALGFADGSISFWSVQHRIQKAKMHLNRLGITCLAISENNKFLISGSAHGLHLWDLEHYTHIGPISGEFYDVTSVSIAHDNVHAVALCSKENNSLAYQPMVVCSLDSRSELHMLTDNYVTILKAAISPNCESIVAACADNAVRVWDFASEDMLAVLHGHSRTIFDVVITEDSACAVTVSLDYKIYVWNLVKCCVKFAVHLEDNNEVFPVSLCNLGYQSVLFGTNKGKIAQLTIGNRKVETIRMESRHSPVTALFYAQGLAILFSKDLNSNPVSFWNVSRKQAEPTLPGHMGRVTCAALSHDQSILVTGSKDKTIRVWDMETKEEKIVFVGHTRRVTCVQITYSKEYVVSGSKDFSVRAWGVHRGKEITVFQGHITPIERIVITVDDLWAVSRSKAKRVIVWNLTTMKEEVEATNKVVAEKWVARYPELKEFMIQDSSCVLF